MEPKKGLLVDGIDFAQVFLFSKILRSAMTALQPPRLLIGTFLVVLLITGGSAWDSIAGPTIHPDGLHAGPLTDAHDRALQRHLRDLRLSYPNDVAPPPAGHPNDWPAFDPDEEVRLATEAYRHDRAEIREKLIEATEDEDVRERQLEQLAASDRRFAADIERVEQRRPKGVYEASARFVVENLQRLADGVFTINIAQVRDSAANLFIELPAMLWAENKAFTILYSLFLLASVAFCGGALCRMAACQAAPEQSVRLGEGVDFAARNIVSLMLAVFLPLVLIALLTLTLAVAGVVLMLPWLDLIGGLLYGLALLFGLILALLLLGYVVGFPLVLPAVACDRSDGADALQRMYAYTLSRPLHLVWYLLVGIVGLAIGYVLVSFIASVTVNMTAWAVGMWTPNSAMLVAGNTEPFDLVGTQAALVHESSHSAGAAWLIRFWQSIVACFVGGYVLAYFFSASTWIYLLMRRACDGQDVEEITASS